MESLFGCCKKKIMSLFWTKEQKKLLISVKRKSNELSVVAVHRLSVTTTRYTLCWFTPESHFNHLIVLWFIIIIIY